jgi:hypothetical protein
MSEGPAPCAPKASGLTIKPQVFGFTFGEGIPLLDNIPMPRIIGAFC